VSGVRCSERSLEAGESLAATATTAEHWLLVEVPGTWPRDVSVEGPLPAPARKRVDTWLEETAGSRLLFVRRPGRPAARTLVFTVHAAESETEVRRIELTHPSELACVDLARDGDATDLHLVLVCGHGTRDACCALRGTAVYGALAAGCGDEELWISSHQGGHRFAANVLVLPAGLQFGRVEPGAAPSLLARALSGRIVLDHYRGRTCYAPPTQAAERIVREAERLEGVADLCLVDADGAHVRFRARDGSEHVVLVEEAAGPRVPASCGAEPEDQSAFRARILRSARSAT
jgi:hypothetical protein